MFVVHRIFNDFGERLFLGFLLDLLRPMQKGSIMPVGVDDPNPFNCLYCALLNRMAAIHSLRRDCLLVCAPLYGA
jgi:hypothetical protein